MLREPGFKDQWSNKIPSRKLAFDEEIPEHNEQSLKCLKEYYRFFLTLIKKWDFRV